MKDYYLKIKTFLNKNEKYVSPVFLFAGFVVDNLSLRRIDLFIENLLIIIYLLIGALGILYLNLFSAGKFKHHFFEKINLFIPLLMQFVFGGLFSVFVVFYSRSASWLSWPFILFLLFFLIGNERFRDSYRRMVFQINIFFIAVFSYSVFSLPILLKDISSTIFLLSGLLSVFIILFLLMLIYKINPKKINESKKQLMISLSVIFVFFNFVYFANIIPPIPLSLIDGGIYHNVQKTTLGYSLEKEKTPWYAFYSSINPSFHWKAGERLYYFSSIFSPSNINTSIYHRWSFYDQAKNRWTETDKLGYYMVGGRDGGYRGYTYKAGLKEGRWRVDVINERGQILGRDSFKIIRIEDNVDTESIVY